MTEHRRDLLENARKPFDINFSDGDDVVIASDDGVDRAVRSALFDAARSAGTEPTLVVVEEPAELGAEPPGPAREAMLAGDGVVMATSKGLDHSEAGTAVVRSGTKVVRMAGTTVESLSGGAASADYGAIYDVSRRIKRRWDEGTTVTISAPAGTELRADIGGETASVHAARCEKVERAKEERYGRVCSFPDGEVPISPVPGTATGTLVWDTTMHRFGRLESPVEATVEDGFVVSIRGGDEAATLDDFLDEFDDENVYNIGEISINTNPGGTISGRIQEDKKVAGYVHVAIGAGGEVDAPVHLDGVISEPTVAIDGTAVVRDGEITVDRDGPGGS